jgi:hypothetical protein
VNPELTLSANIDPYFSGVLTAAITGEDEIEVEEAFVRTSTLPEGFTGKLGRFFSGFGYLNEVHAHAWDFVDQPLVYQALFGGQFQQNGVQVKWLAPTDLYIELGAETGNGDGFPSTRRARNGLNGGHIVCARRRGMSAITRAGAPGCRGSISMPKIARGGIADPTASHCSKASAAIPPRW